jgi:ParB family transcriptional regulator, chromosome partitioning protein
MKNTKLGRGLSDLLDENDLTLSDKEEVTEVDIKLIKTNPNQPRKYFDEKSLNELKDSIINYGLMQPIILKPVANGYHIIAGERRFRASKLANLRLIPSIIRDYNPRLHTELALIENIQREKLSAIEEAAAFKKLIENYGYTHAELSNKIGKSRSYITNMVGLLNLPVDVAELVMNRSISMGHARSLSKLKDETKIRKLATKITEDKISVRELESLISKPISTFSKETEKNIKTKLRIKPARISIKSRSIIIEFKNQSDLEDALESINKAV